MLLLRAEHGGRFSGGEPPAWVAEWLASRSDRAQKKETQLAEKAAAPVDPQAAARSEAQRWKRIEGAAADLQRFLADQLARGLGSLDASTLKTWATMAARMVKANFFLMIALIAALACIALWAASRVVQKSVISNQ